MNITEIQKFYHEECKESERLASQAGKIEYLTTMKYLTEYCKEGMDVLDACAGGGIYAFPLAEKGCLVVAGDLIDVNVEHIKKLDGKNAKLKSIYQGSVLDLARFEGESFDVVLNLGSYYHLCDEKDRERSIGETLRVLKKNGIYCISYVNRYANYMAHFEEFKENFSFLVNYMKTGHIEDSTLFYSTTPEMIEDELTKFNVKILRNVATDGPLYLYRDIVEQMSEADFRAFMDIHLETCDKKSVLGYSEHGLIIAQKS